VPEPLSAVSANDDDDDAPVRPRKRPSGAAALPDKKPKGPHTEDDSKADERPRKRPTNAAELPDVPRLKADPSTDDADERPRKRPTNAAALPPIPRLKSPPKPTSEATPPNDSEDGGAAENQPRKRPTNAAVIPNNQRREARRLQEDREREQQQRAGGDGTGRPAAGVSDFVKQHYNAVPERGRQWRKTDSKIRGLRSFNNWVKSALMHKCVPRDDGPQPGDGRDENDGGGPRRGRRIKVLDVGCGKGGDLMKWQTHRVETYVGLDPADVSIHQARERYRGMARKSKFIFRADFVVRDCFGQSLEDVGAVRAVGWDRNIRDRWGGGGFDVVSMMFCMHYAFESEEKARTMLLNVAAALRRGGKLIGVIPNSDVLSDHVNDFHRRKSGAPVADDDDDDWDPEKSLDAPAEPRPDAVVRDDDEDGGPLSWGNSIYQVKFPGKLPADGVFRPPFGWKYFYFLEEAVEQVPEFVVPWEAFRG
jgi:mRNA (guanine-N7-)-methyltransferase